MLSFVATSRNDDHGGDALRRTQSFIDRLAQQCERHQLAAELVLVEWNPPKARPSLSQVLGWPRGSRWFSARVITVPEDIHLRHNFGRRLSLFQMIAKNVGIRRALGDYVIATNIDIIFSDELFEWLGRERLRPGVLYRSDRWDIPNEIQLEPDLDILLRRARDEAIRRSTRQGIYLRKTGELLANAGADVENVFINIKEKLSDLVLLARAGSDGACTRLAESLHTIIAHDMPRLRRNFRIPKLHTVACGDFTMLSRRDWFALRGYPEWHLYSWHIDSVLVYQAHYNGIEVCEIGESCVHYHIEHDYGSGWTPEAGGSLWDRLEQIGVPYLSFYEYLDYLFKLQDDAEKKIFTVYNGPDWGLHRQPVATQKIVKEDSSARAPLAVNRGPLVENYLASLRPAALDPVRQPGVSHAAGVIATYHQGEEGQRELCVECSEPWGYAALIELSGWVGGFREYFIQLEICLEQGALGLALLNAAGTRFVAERQLITADGVWRKVLRPVNDAADTSKLIFRNVSPDGGGLRFRLRNVDVLIEDVLDEKQKAPASSTGVPVSSGDASNFFDVAASQIPVSLMRPEAQAMVRLLGPGTGEDPDRGTQALIITPIQQGARGASLELPADPSMTSLIVELRVIDGIAGLGVWSNGGERMLVEGIAAGGASRNCVTLDLQGEPLSESPRLVIRNLSETGPAKLLVRDIRYH